MQKCRSYGPDKLNIWPFWPLFDPCDLDFQITWTNVSNGTSPSQGQYMTIFTFIWPLWHWPSIYLKKMFQMALLLIEGNNCAKLFWNPCINVQVMARTSSIHVYDHFDHYLTPVTLTFNLHKKCFKWPFSSSRATTVPHCFEIHALLYKLWTNPDGWMHSLTHAHTQNKNCNNYVSLICNKWAQQNFFFFGGGGGGGGRERCCGKVVCVCVVGGREGG